MKSFVLVSKYAMVHHWSVSSCREAEQQTFFDNVWWTVDVGSTRGRLMKQHPLLAARVLVLVEYYKIQFQFDNGDWHRQKIVRQVHEGGDMWK